MLNSVHHFRQCSPECLSRTFYSSPFGCIYSLMMESITESRGQIAHELLQKNISDESVSCLGIYSREIRDTINKSKSISILVELTMFHEKHLSVFLRKNSEVQLKRLWHKENAYKCFHTWNEAHLPLLRYSWRRKKRGAEKRRKKRRRKKKCYICNINTI